MGVKNTAIGVDLGGHSISAGIVSDGTIQDKIEESTASRAIEKTVAQVAAMVRRLEAGSKCPVGVGLPGVLDKTRSSILGIANFDCPPEFPFKKHLEDSLERKVAIENDANCYTLGEGWGGAAKGLSDYVVLTLGTGIGGGIVVGGRLLLGAHGMAGEPGHMPVDKAPLCTESCGGKGHVESFFSADSIERRAARLGLDGDVKKLWKRRGESGFDELWDEPLDILARGTAGVVSLLDPQAVVFGGGLSKGEGFVATLRPRIESYLCRPYRATLDLRPSILGSDAPLIGAAALAAGNS